MKFVYKQKNTILIFLASLSLAIFLLPIFSFAQEGQGVLNSSCAPDETIDCQPGLYCKTNPDGTGTCADSAGIVVPTTPDSSTNNTNNTGITCNDPSLELKNGICIPKNQYTSGLAGSTDANDFILKLVKILLGFAGVIAVVFVIIGG